MEKICAGRRKILEGTYSDVVYKTSQYTTYSSGFKNVAKKTPPKPRFFGLHSKLKVLTPS